MDLKAPTNYLNKIQNSNLQKYNNKVVPIFNEINNEWDISRKKSPSKKIVENGINCNP